ncbi:MAG: acetyl-CoA carboxylase biotin carboxyl carrier protein [Pyrinomonadaceae bacterium]|nr:acetyl-CoA carboxylase biotin carboxyl carrier protein [Pyrinomonadaceae bacterium]
MSDKTASAKAMENDKSEGTKGRHGKKHEPEASLNMDELRELAELVNEHGFTDFEFENENIRVRLSKQVTAQVVQAAPVQVQQAAPAATPATAEAAPAAPAEEELHKITSPIVGTFYRAPGPDKEPYVKEGSKVTPDSVVCIVEAMKLMNEIQAEASGEIVKIYVENGQPVEYGQPLFGIRK